MIEHESLELELEVDPDFPVDALLRVGGTWTSSDEDVQVRIRPLADGHGFGLSEVVEIAVTVGTGVASELVADAIRGAVKGVIRKVRSGEIESDGSKEGLADLVEKDRNSKAPDG